MIVCAYFSDFAGAIERRRSSIHEATPIILIKSGKVAAASTDAAQIGIHFGMRLSQARAFCPDALYPSFDEASFRESADDILERLTRFTARVEPAPGFWNIPRRKAKQGFVHPSAAIFYFDFAKLQEEAADSLTQEIAECVQGDLQTPIRFGVATGKFPAYVAARSAKSPAPILIPPGGESAFLAPFPVTLLQLDKETLRRLHLFGIRNLGQFAALPVSEVIDQFGLPARDWHQLAQGQDTRPITPFAPKPIERIRQLLDGAVEDRCMLENLLQRMGCDMASRIGEKGYAVRLLRLMISLENGDELEASISLRQPTPDGRRLGRALLRLFSQLSLTTGAVAIEVIADDLTQATWQQLELFAQPSTIEQRMTELLENLVARYGSECLYRSSITHLSSLVPEERFQLQPADVL